MGIRILLFAITALYRDYYGCQAQAQRAPFDCSSLCFYIMNGLESPFYTSKNVGARHALPLMLLFADAKRSQESLALSSLHLGEPPEAYV